MNLRIALNRLLCESEIRVQCTKEKKKKVAYKST